MTKANSKNHEQGHLERHPEGTVVTAGGVTDSNDLENYDQGFIFVSCLEWQASRPESETMIYLLIDDFC